MAGMHQKAYKTRSSNAKGKVKYVVWTTEMDNCLTKILAEQVKKGNKVDNILKPVAFAAALKVLNEQFGLDLTKEHIKNRLKTWRKQFGVLKELLAHRGFGWDEARKMVIADNSMWNDYIRAHPDARIFRAKFIENYDELCIIIGNDQAIASCSDNDMEINVDMTVDKRDLDLTTVSEIQSVGNQTKNLRWTDEMDYWLGEILVDQVRKGNKVDKILHTEAYETAVSALNAKFGPYITKDHIKNRLKTWKKQYELIKELLSHTGFEWDETRKMIIANDSTWNDYIKTHPDARTFRARVFENYDQLCTIYGHCNEPVQCNEPMESVSICPILCDSSVKDQGKHMRWTNEMDRCLSAILVQQIMLGNKSKFDNKLKAAAYEAAVLAINERFQLDLTKDQVKNRLKTWKKQYEILKELLDQSGFAWDEKRKMVNANDSVWNEYIKVNPDARLLKGRVIRNYNELCIIIGHSDPPNSYLNGAGANLGLTTNDEVMNGQGAYYHGTDNAKEKGKYVAWTDEMDRCLTELLVKQVMLGNKLEKNFKTSAYITAATVLNEKFGLDLTKENIKNRLKTWKKQYGLVKEMLSHGFEWDERRKMVVANDSEWNEYIKKRPDARHLRARCIENYNKLGVIVGNEQASGQLSETCERLEVHPTSNYEEHAETPAHIVAIEETSHDKASDEMQGSSQQTRARPSSSHSKQPSKRRRASDVMLEMMSVMAADIGRIADALTESNKTRGLDEVFETVQNIPDFDDDLIIEACEYLCTDEKRALMFMKLDERLRKKWLLKRLRGQSG